MLQLQGTKHWKVGSASTAPWPLRETPAVGFDSDARDWDWPRTERLPDTNSLPEIELQAGDLLYLPSGFGHEAWTGAVASMHLTLALRAFTWTELAGGRPAGICGGRLGAEESGGARKRGVHTGVPAAVCGHSRFRGGARHPDEGFGAEFP